MKIDDSIAVRAVRHANGAVAEPGVCTPAIARYTGASGSLYIPLHESRGWGNLCTNLWQSLCLALLMNRVPVLVRPGRLGTRPRGTILFCLLWTSCML